MSEHSWDCAAQTAHACDCGLDDLLDHDPNTCVTTFLQSERAESLLAEALHATPGIITSGFGYTPAEHIAKCKEKAPAILASLLEEMKK